MDLRALDCFRTVVELGSISKAAAYLRIAQPALSRIIQKFEHSLNVELLQRSSTGVAPTPAGRMLLERTAGVESTLAEISREITSYAHDVVGPLRVGVQPSFSHELMPRIVRRYMQEHPKVDLRIFAGYSADMLDGLLDEAMDVVVADTPSHTPREFTVLPLWVESLNLIGPTEGGDCKIFDGGKTALLSEALKLPLILPSRRYSIRQLIEQTAAREHLKVSPLIEVDGPDMIFALVRSGIGFTLMPSLGASNFSRRKFQVVETLPSINRPLSIVVRTSVMTDRRVVAFVRLFKEAVLEVASTDLFRSIRVNLHDGAEAATARPLKLSIVSTYPVRGNK